MSKHWNPQDEIAQRRETETNRRWPEGATMGLVLVATACLGLVIGLYAAAGPRDVFTP